MGLIRDCHLAGITSGSLEEKLDCGRGYGVPEGRSRPCAPVMRVATRKGGLRAASELTLQPGQVFVGTSHSLPIAADAPSLKRDGNLIQ